MNLSWFLKYTFITVLLCLFLTDSIAQSILSKTFYLSKTSGSTVELLDSIEKELQITFSYSNRICLKDHIQLSSRENTLQGFLKEIFESCSVTFNEKKNKIVILPSSEQSVIPKYVVRGFVHSAKNGEILIGSSVYDGERMLGTSSNNFGFYSLTIPKGELILNSSYIGYRSEQKRFFLNRDTVINFKLEYNSLISEVPVVSFFTPEGINSTRSSTINLPISQIKKVPSFLGEIDVARTLQLLPGINGGSEGVSGLYVRGGGTDQNLFLLDDVPVYNISHLFGFFSVFNEDAINNVSVTKGGFPARYGGRLSSVVDIRLKDGNNESLHGTVGLGMMSSKLALDGPLFGENTTYSLSFRRSYYDLVAAAFQSGSSSRTLFYFYDVNAKVTHKMNDKNRLFFSFYGGKDKFYTKYNFTETSSSSQSEEDGETIDVNDEISSGWGNVVSSARWNRIYNDKLFSNISIAYSNYSYTVGYEENQIEDDSWDYYEKNYYSGIKDALCKVDYDYFFNAKHHVRFGGDYTYHTFNPGVDIIRESQNTVTVLDSTIGGENIHGHDFYLYLEDDFDLTQSLKINTGMHVSLYSAKGKTYSSWQPRLALRYLLTSKLALKASYSQMSQYMHQITTSSVSLPTDLWIPVTNKIRPQHATQYEVGGKWEFRKGFNMSIMGYYKDYRNLLEYTGSSTSIIYSDSWEDDLVFGKGIAKGLEFLIHKKTGEFTGWVGYTLAKATEQFNELNGGVSFPADNDRRHDIGIFGNYIINPKVDVSATWLFGSGSAVTLPSQKYYSPALPTMGTLGTDSYSEYISEINGYRMPDFHRLDIGVNLKKKNKLGERTWSFGLYNAYGRQNAFALYFVTEEDEDTGEEARVLKQLSIFPFPLPYVRYTLKF
jgi:hypothetical protein